MLRPSNPYHPVWDLDMLREAQHEYDRPSKGNYPLFITWTTSRLIYPARPQSLSSRRRPHLRPRRRSGWPYRRHPDLDPNTRLRNNLLTIHLSPYRQTTSPHHSRRYQRRTQRRCGSCFGGKRRLGRHALHHSRREQISAAREAAGRRCGVR